MTQAMRPISNITAGLTGDFAAIDEETPSDADYAYGANNSTDTLEVLLTDLSGSVPGAGTCTVRIREAQADSDAGTPAPSSGGANASFDLLVLEGGTTIASSLANACNEGAFADFATLTFSSALISNWANVRIRFVSTGTGGTPSGRRAAAISHAWLEVPNASAAPFLPYYAHRSIKNTLLRM